MPWFIDTKGTPGQCNTAVAALTTGDDGNGQNAQLARAISDIVNEVNSLSANQQIHVTASGFKDANVSSIQLQVEVISGSLGGQIMVPPFKPGPPHYS